MRLVASLVVWWARHASAGVPSSSPTRSPSAALKASPTSTGEVDGLEMLYTSYYDAESSGFPRWLGGVNLAGMDATKPWSGRGVSGFNYFGVRARA